MAGAGRKNLRLRFLGATKTVTGSKYLLEHAGKRLLVDCGLFQGYKELRLRNWSPLPLKASAIDAVLLTHAHIDHSGYIPLLVRQGFRGRIYCSKATYDLCRILLPDSGYLQEEDANRANRYGYSKHHPALPLYTRQDAEDCLAYFHPVPFGRPRKIAGDINAEFRHGGHILGASIIAVTAGGRRIVFSGDLGRPHDPIMLPPDHIAQADYLVIESTYGNRRHEPDDPMDELGSIISSTVARGGKIIIPAFAVGRTQNILFYIHELKRQGRIPDDLPVFMDSPMAIDTTELYLRHNGDHGLSPAMARTVCQTARPVRSVEESKAIDCLAMPCIIISASGMATGGRVLHHLKSHLGDSRNTILFAGYQAGGTRGDRLLRGEKSIKIHGQMWPVNARIEVLHNVSAHADYKEILDWLGHFRQPPRMTFVTHGEEEAALAMCKRIGDKLGWRAEVPDYLEAKDLP